MCGPWECCIPAKEVARSPPDDAALHLKCMCPWVLRRPRGRVHRPRGPPGGVQTKHSRGCVCVECLIGKQKKPILFKVTEPSSIPYRTPPACAKMAAYSDPPPVIPVPESGVAQAAYAETLLPGSPPARNVFRYWGSPRACYRIPCCE